MSVADVYFPVISATGCELQDDESQVVHFSPVEHTGRIVVAGSAVTGANGNYTDGASFYISIEDSIAYIKTVDTNEYLIFGKGSESVVLSDTAPCKERRIRFHSDSEFDSVMTLSRWHDPGSKVRVRKHPDGLGRLSFNKEDPEFVFQFAPVEE